MNLTPFKNLSLLNFATEDARSKMLSALEQVRGQFGKTYSLHSAEVISETKRPMVKSLNPANPREILGSVEAASEADSETALKVLTEGAKTWARTPAEKRIQLVLALGDWMEARRYELSAWMVYEVGKIWREADADVCEAIDFCRYYAQEMNRLSQPRLTQVVSGERDELAYFPKGVSFVVAPWNFPLAILTGMTVASLVTGNTVAIKPAEPSPIIAAMLVRGLREVGFPLNSFYFLPGPGSKIGPFMTSDPRVDLIVFTGSMEVGLSIIETAARSPKPGQRGVKKVICEMGGKNALIIDEDADLDEAISASVHSAFGYQGQKCSALSRLLVHEKVYDVFVKRFVEASKSIRVGDPSLPEHQMGPVVDEKSQKRILSTIVDAKTRLKLLHEGSVDGKAGYYVPPTIFEVTDTQEKWFQTEIFGPVVLVKKVRSLEEAVSDANSVQYALTGGIFSRSPSHIDYVKREMEVGNLYINRAITGAIVERHPFGGFKFSGVGSKAGGPDYLLQFLEPRTFAENTVRRGFAGS